MRERGLGGARPILNKAGFGGFEFSSTPLPFPPSPTNLVTLSPSTHFRYTKNLPYPTPLRSLPSNYFRTIPKMASMLFASRPDLHHHDSFDNTEPLVDLAPASPSTSESDDSEYVGDSTRDSTRDSTPDNFKHSIDNPNENDGIKTTRQGKDWRGASHIHKKTFWEVRAFSS